MAAFPLKFCFLACTLLTVNCITAHAIDSSKDGSGNDGPFRSNGGSVYGARGWRSMYGVGPRMLQISRSKIPIELDMLVENDENDRLRRFDDYGHVRFGKRGGDVQFDDYGHMRFGRSL